MGLASERGKVVEVALQGAEVARVRHLLVEPVGERSPEATELPQAGVELGPVRVHHPQQGRHLRIGQSSARLQLPEDDVKLRGGMIVALLCVPTPLQDGGGQALAEMALHLGLHIGEGGEDVMAPTTVREALRVVLQMVAVVRAHRDGQGRTQLMGFYGHHLVPHVILRRHRGLEVRAERCVHLPEPVFLGCSFPWSDDDRAQPHDTLQGEHVEGLVGHEGLLTEGPSREVGIEEVPRVAPRHGERLGNEAEALGEGVAVRLPQQRPQPDGPRRLVRPPWVPVGDGVCGVLPPPPPPPPPPPSPPPPRPVGVAQQERRRRRRRERGRPRCDR